VLRNNEPATREKPRLISQAIGRPGESAADAVAELIAALGQPASLRAAGVKREQLPAIAEAAMKNLWVRSNPRPLRSSEDVMQLLEAAW
jgi:maleylacetate reductase